MGLGKQIGRMFGGDPLDAPARSVYEGIVRQARQPAFYADCGVPDSIDGRFELVALHAFLVLRRLKHGGGDGANLAQALVDTLILDLDRSLREMGVGDMGISRRIKTMARGFYGRIAAYEAGLDGPDDKLRAALARNLYGTISEAPKAEIGEMIAYVRREAAGLGDQAVADLMAGKVTFGPPPKPEGGKAA